MKIDTEKRERLIQLVQAGADADLAAESIGLTPEQFDEWKSDLDFLKRLDGAMTTARLLAQIELRKRAPGTWLAKNKKAASKSATPKAEKPKKNKEKEPKLPLKQEQFVHEYVANGGNATQAAIKVGYSKKTAQEQSSRLLSKVIIAEAVERLRAKLLARTDFTYERWAREVASQVGFDIAKIFDEDGNLLPVHLMPPEARTAIAGIEVEEIYDFVQGEGKVAKGVVRKVRLRDKAPWANMMGKALGTLKDRVEHTGKDGAPIAMTLDSLRQAFEEESRANRSDD